MSKHLGLAPGQPPADVPSAVKRAIESALEGAVAEVTGGGGHFTIVVEWGGFAELNRLERHRTVLRAVKELMAGDAAPVHAVDSIVTKVPA